MEVLHDEVERGLEAKDRVQIRNSNCANEASSRTGAGSVSYHRTMNWSAREHLSKFLAPVQDSKKQYEFQTKKKELVTFSPSISELSISADDSLCH